MIVYHGSPKTGLKELSYTEELSRFGGEEGLKHGSGIYLTTSLKEAQAYAVGGSCYKIRVLGDVFDATDREVLENFVLEIEKECGVEGLLLKNQGIKDVIRLTLRGEVSGINFSKALKDVVDNDVDLYQSLVVPYFQGDLDKVDNFFSSRFSPKAIKLNNTGSESWVIGLDLSGSNLEIIEEFPATETED